MPLKSNKHHPKGLSCFFPPFPCQHTDLQSGSSITAQHTVTQRVKKRTHAEKMDSAGVGWKIKCYLCIWWRLKKGENVNSHFVPIDISSLQMGRLQNAIIVVYMTAYSKSLRFTTVIYEIMKWSSLLFLLLLLRKKNLFCLCRLSHPSPQVSHYGNCTYGLRWCCSRASVIKHELIIDSHTCTCCPEAQWVTPVLLLLLLTIISSGVNTGLMHFSPEAFYPRQVGR